MSTLVWYLAPAIMVAFCYGIYLIARRDLDDTHHKHGPAE